MIGFLKALAPYFAVTIFWCVWPNAWLAILAYHTQILLWNRHAFRQMHPLPPLRKTILIASPLILAGPLLYALLPIITRTELSAWLTSYHLTGSSLILMIPYFGLVHPVLEQIHWHQIRKTSAWAHPLFAGYHMIVLASFLNLQWLILCFALLCGTSILWKIFYRNNGNIFPAIISHILADLGIIIAVWARSVL